MKVTIISVIILTALATVFIPSLEGSIRDITKERLEKALVEEMSTEEDILGAIEYVKVIQRNINHPEVTRRGDVLIEKSKVCLIDISEECYKELISETEAFVTFCFRLKEEKKKAAEAASAAEKSEIDYLQ